MSTPIRHHFHAMRVLPTPAVPRLIGEHVVDPLLCVRLRFHVLVGVRVVAVVLAEVEQAAGSHYPVIEVVEVSVVLALVAQTTVDGFSAVGHVTLTGHFVPSPPEDSPVA